MEWVKCSDRMPSLNIGNECLFYNCKQEITFGYAFHIEDDYVWINDMMNEKNEIARYWMPLPQPPKE